MEPAASYIALLWYLIFMYQFSPKLADGGQDSGPCRRVYFTVEKLSLTHQGISCPKGPSLAFRYCQWPINYNGK